MHQSHNIPWPLLDKHLKFVRQDKSYTPERTGLVSRRLPTCTSDLKHFVRKLSDTIHTFSKTEREKYPAKFTHFPEKDFLLFSDELMAEYPEYLTTQNQRIEFWIKRGHESVKSDTRLQYSTADGGLADVVKVLIHANQMETLLMLASHPLVPLGSLNHLSWGHHLGFSRVKESAMRIYLFLNAMDAVGMLWNGKYVDSDHYESIIKGETQSMDYPAQQVPHQEFLDSIGERGWDDGRAYKRFARSWDTVEEGDKTTAKELGYVPGTQLVAPPLVHKDPEALREYVKHVFALMYRYDMLVRECGLDPEWEAEAVGWGTPFYKVLEMTHEWDEAEGKWRMYL